MLMCQDRTVLKKFVILIVYCILRSSTRKRKSSKGRSYLLNTKLQYMCGWGGVSHGGINTGGAHPCTVPPVYVDYT